MKRVVTVVGHWANLWLWTRQCGALSSAPQQVAVAAIVAVDEPALLLAMRRVVRGVEIEDDLRRRRCMGLQEQLDEQPLDRRTVMTDLVVSRRLLPAQLQPVQRALARQRRASSLPPSAASTRVVPKLIVVDQVLIPQRNAVDPLTDQRRNLMLDQRRITVVGKAARKPIDQPDRPSRPTQQQRPRV